MKLIYQDIDNIKRKLNAKQVKSVVRQSHNLLEL